MKRVAITERPDWREKATEFGFKFHTMYGEPYWCEDAYYQFTLAQIEEIESATAELHQMCLQVVEKVVSSDALMAKFQIPKHTWDFVRSSWRTSQPSLYSRLDWPTTASIRPNCWRTMPIRQPRCMKRPSSNGCGWKTRSTPAISARSPISTTACRKNLIERFANLKAHHGFGLLHLACCQDSEEDRGTVQYLQDCALEAGVPTEFLFMEEIGLGEKGQFTDLQDQVIGNLFKLYPWEFMLREMFSTKLEDAGVRWLEPAWKSIISNKALLPMLWEMFPDHPNLLAAYFAQDEHPQLNHYVTKPLFSREGANIQIVQNGQEVARVDGPYGEEGMIVQQFHRCCR